jgi:hypothetical protein
VDLAADQRPVTIQHIDALYLVNANQSDLSHINLGHGAEARLASKKEDSGDTSGGFELDADGSTVERVAVEGTGRLRAKNSKVRDINATKSTAPQRWRSIGGVAAVILGSLVVAYGREAASTSMGIEAMGTRWSLVTTIPGLAIVMLGAVILALPSRKV